MSRAFGISHPVVPRPTAAVRVCLAPLAASQGGLLTATLAGLAELQVFHDKFHWKVDSDGYAGAD